MSISRILPAITLFLVSCSVAPVHATTAVVPDEFPTIQAGIDSKRDIVLVRGGHYEEDLVLRFGVTLAAIPSEAGADTVETTGLRLTEWGQTIPGQPWPDRRLVDVSGFHFTGRVRKELGPHDFGCTIAFTACRMDSGLTLGPRDVDGGVTINSCTIINGLSVGTPAAATVTDNTILGGGIYVHAEGYYLIRGNRVHGPAACGIWAWSGASAELLNNTVVGTDVGVHLGGDYVRMWDNTIKDCSSSGIAVYGWHPDIFGNRVENCGGYGVDGFGGPRINRNTILSCRSGGIRLPGSTDQSSLWRNVVGRCGGPGIEVTADPYSSNPYNVEGNTCYLNSGPGFSLSGLIGNIANNVAFENSGPGLLWTGSATPTLACNDWFANTGGATSGAQPGVTDLAVDPLFCNPGQDDVQLSAGSPLLDASGCGLIGALGRGCADVPTPVLLSFVSVETGADGIQLTWLAGGSMSAVATVYRSPAGGEWTRIGEITADGTGYLRYTDHVDGTATRMGYRVGIIEGGIERFYGETWVDVPVSLAFALSPLSPNPSAGRSLVGFALPVRTWVRLTLTDVQGREVAVLADGIREAGRHTAVLDAGDLRAGMYFVRMQATGVNLTRRLAVVK